MSNPTIIASGIHLHDTWGNYIGLLSTLNTNIVRISYGFRDYCRQNWSFWAKWLRKLDSSQLLQIFWKVQYHSGRGRNEEKKNYPLATAKTGGQVGRKFWPIFYVTRFFILLPNRASAFSTLHRMTQWHIRDKFRANWPRGGWGQLSGGKRTSQNITLDLPKFWEFAFLQKRQ